MNQHSKGGKRGKENQNSKKRDKWNVNFGGTKFGRAYHYIRMPAALQPQRAFGNRNIPAGDYVTPRTQRHQSQSDSSQSDVKCNTQTPQPQQQTPTPSDLETPASQEQQTPQFQSTDNHDYDIDMPPSRDATPMPHAPDTDESERVYVPPTPELAQRAQQHYRESILPSDHSKPIKIKFGQEYMDVIEAVKHYLPSYYRSLLTTVENRAVFRKYYEEICRQHGCLKLGNERYCLRSWVKDKLSSKHYWHCSKSRGSKDYTCDCDAWQATDDMKCFHTLIATLADDYLKFKQQPIAADIKEHQKTNGEHVVYLGTFHPKRHMRDCAMFSVRPKNRHSLHYSTIKFYNDGQVTCDWHSGRKICEHKILWGEALGLSLTYLRGLRQAAIDSYYESALNQFIIKPISTRRIPLHPNFRFYCIGIYDDWADYPDYDKWTWRDRNLNNMFVCEFEFCECGQELRNCPIKRRDAILYQMEYAVMVTLGDKQCPKCHKWNHYDGLNDHLFNFNNSELYCHGLLNEFTMNCSSQSRPSMTAFWKQRAASYVGSGSKVNFVSKPHFAVVWRSFIYMQLWKFNLVCVTCDRGLKRNINGDATGECDAVVADGVATGFSKKYSKWVINPKHIFDENYIVKGLPRKSDRFIAAAKIRNYLDRFLYNHLPPIQQDRARQGKKKKNSKYKKKLNKTEFRSLTAALGTQNHLKPLKQLIRWLKYSQQQIKKDFAKQDLLYCADFFRALSTGEPVYYICPSAICDILIGGKESITNENNIHKILEYSHSMYLVTFGLNNNYNWPDWYFELLQCIGKRSKEVIDDRKNTIGNGGKWEERQPTQEQQNTWKQWWSYGTHFSGKPARMLPLSEIDMKREEYKQNREKRNKEKKSKRQLIEQKRDVYNDIDNDNGNDAPIGSRLNRRIYTNEDDNDDSNPIDEPTACNKKFEEQNGRPSMMIFRCAAHSVCVGRHVITKSESVRDLFAFLVVFYVVMPFIIIADYMCNMLAFAFNRAPALFEYVKAAIDSIHGEGHIGCSNALNIKIKKQLEGRWRRLQDEGVEQRHVILNRFRLMGVWMRMDSFMLITAVMIAIDNRQILRKLHPKGVERNTGQVLDRNKPASWADEYNKYNDVSNRVDEQYQDMVLDIGNVNDDASVRSDENSNINFQHGSDENSNINFQRGNHANEIKSNDNDGNIEEKDGQYWYHRLFDDRVETESDVEDELFQGSDREDDIDALLDEINRLYANDDKNDNENNENNENNNENDTTSSDSESGSSDTVYHTKSSVIMNV